MKRLVLVLLTPFLMATQCEDDFSDSGFETTYNIKNDTGTMLYLFRNERLFEIATQSEVEISSDLNTETKPIVPSQTITLEPILLYTKENDNFILAYEQRPIIDELWAYEEPSVNRFEYTLIITDEVLGGN